MQTKATIFFLTVSVYLLGLLGYSNNRAAAQSHQVSGMMTTDRLSRFVDQLEGSVPTRTRDSEMFRATVKPAGLAVGDPLIVGMILDFNQDIDGAQANQLAGLIESTSDRYGVDPLLVTALVSQESAFHADATSPVGAIGLGQLMPYTAAELGVDPSDPEQNLDGCVRYLAQNLDAWAHTDDPLSLALASYNAGPGAVENYGGVPPFDETENYVAVITDRYRHLLDNQGA